MAESGDGMGPALLRSPIPVLAAAARLIRIYDLPSSSATFVFAFSGTLVALVC